MLLWLKRLKMMMSDNSSVLIVGAGAIGRGFIAPVMARQGYDIHFVDCDRVLVKHFQDRQVRNYLTAFSEPEGYEFEKVPYLSCHHIDQLKFEDSGPDFVVFAVGMKNLEDAASRIVTAYGDERPTAVYSVENDPTSVSTLEMVFGNSSSIYFGVPDVISSNEAPERLLKLDPLCLSSEVGELYLQGNYLHGEITGYDDAYVHTHWICKKYLHNTPHAALAYCGAVKGYTYIHEAAADPQIGEIVEELMSGIQVVLQKKYKLDDGFLEDYADKEILRFKNPSLHDPISRVGRNPDIKLKPEERIVHIANLFVEYEIGLSGICKLISDALDYPLCPDLAKDRNELDFPALLVKYTGVGPTSTIGEEVLAQRKMRSQLELTP